VTTGDLFFASGSPAPAGMRVLPVSRGRTGSLRSAEKLLRAARVSRDRGGEVLAPQPKGVYPTLEFRQDGRRNRAGGPAGC
jgi:hypothetical protein